MHLLINLAFPWLLLLAVRILEPATIDPANWMLHGLRGTLFVFELPGLVQRLGLLGLFVPLACFHNLAFIVVRLVQKRVRMDFLPMIRFVLLWCSLLYLAYVVWISFHSGAQFGEFQNQALFVSVGLALSLGLAFFIKNDSSLRAAQLVAFLVAWAPLFSIVSTMAGNHLRPETLFAEVLVETGAPLQGWEELDDKVKTEGFTRLAIKKEGLSFTFPSLAKNLRFNLDSSDRIISMESDLDPISKKRFLKLPEDLEVKGWRSHADLAKALRQFCEAKDVSSGGGLKLEWSKADAVLTVLLHRCEERLLRWSTTLKTSSFVLGSLDQSAAERIRVQRESEQLSLEALDKVLLKHADWRQRKLGYSLLGQVNDPAAIPLLVKGFYDADVEVRQVAAIALLSWGTKVEEPMAKALIDSNPFMRGDALRIVAMAQKQQAHPVAYKLLNDSSPYVRISAVQALAPFIRDNTVFKTLMRLLDQEFAAFRSDSSDFFKDPFRAELGVVIASSNDVRTASFLLRAMPKFYSNNTLGYERRAHEAIARALRSMTNWLGVDYLQAVARRAGALDSRQKALSIMAHWREIGDEEVYIKTLNDNSMREHALALSEFFKSEAVSAAILKIQQSEIGAR